MKKLIIAAMVFTLALPLAACQATDVVGKVAVTSFEAVLNKIPDKVASDEINNGWSLESPTGERFVWSKDFSKEGNPDIMLEFDAKPFINAGLFSDAFRISSTALLILTSLSGDISNPIRACETGTSPFTL
jgi:hypothetical protein